MTEIMNLAFHERYVEVTSKEGAVSQQKLIDYSQVRDLFQQEAPTMDTGNLPGEYGVQRVVVRNNYRYILYLEPARIVDVHHQGRRSAQEEIHRENYDSEEAYDEAVLAFEQEHRGERNKVYKFTTPILCWMVKMDTRSGRTDGAHMNLYAMKSPIITGMEQLYMPPFSNIFDRNDICWGNNRINLPTPKAIQGLSTLFFMATANMDLSEGRLETYDRRYFPGTAFRPIHFHMDIDRMLQDPNETPESTLEFVKSKLLTVGSSVEQAFNRFIRG